jgi:tRNA pseudouridine13 synthase
VSPWPYLTAALKGSGGVLKHAPEDFEVEEVPAYLPSGEGEHLFLWIEKRDTTSEQVARALARHLGLDEREVGCAGLKDRRAVTRQFFSVPARGVDVASLEGALGPNVRVLRAERHGNKLRTGHLRGNRFRLRLREVTDVAAARASFELLVHEGVPNYFGDQRFGKAFDNAALGKALLKGERLPRRPSRFERRLYLSALQSLLFNRLLAERVAEGSLGRALAGDVLRKEATGGLFVCEDPAVDSPRVEAFEVSPAGPMFGPKMVASRGAVADRELAALAAEGLTHQAFERGGDETAGARRAYRFRLEAPTFEAEGESLVLGFTLPSGSYATVVLREVTKTDDA